MDTLTPISEEFIRSRVGDQSFRRGKPYFQRGAVINTRRQGTTIRARCHGSLPDPYRLSVTLENGSIAAADCSCPVGAGGYCKHIAAMLLTFLDDPDRFVETPTPDEVLAGRSTGELIALIKLMLRRAPELETLLETPLPGTGTGNVPITAQSYRSLADAAFGGIEYDYSWGMEFAIAEELASIVEIAAEFTRGGNAASAATVYQAVAESILDRLQVIQDEEGILMGVVADCVNGLGECLAEVHDPLSREAILYAMFEVSMTDIVEFGDVGMTGSVPGMLKEHASTEERVLVAQWIRDVMPGSADDSPFQDRWVRDAFSGFILDLEEDTLSDEEYLRFCREMGLSSDLVERLLDLGRVDEALQATRESNDDLTNLADLLVLRGHADEAGEIVLERSRASPDERLTLWLKRHYTHRNPQAALDMAMQIFRSGNQFLNQYFEIRTLARQAGKWEAVQPEILSILEASQRYDLLIDVALDAGDVARALDLLKLRPEPSVSLYLGTRRLTIAHAAEETHPHSALEIYIPIIDHQIRMRQRGNYREATKLLKRVKDAHERAGTPEIWEAYIADLRGKHKNLPALQDELNKACL